MSVLTVELPEQLLANLKAQASKENTSLEKLVVFALTRQATPAYKVTKATPQEIQEQRARFAALRQSLGKISLSEARRILDEREEVEPESDLDPQAAAVLRRLIEEKQRREKP